MVGGGVGGKGAEKGITTPAQEKKATKKGTLFFFFRSSTPIMNTRGRFFRERFSFLLDGSAVIKPPFVFPKPIDTQEPRTADNA